MQFSSHLISMDVVLLTYVSSFTKTTVSITKSLSKTFSINFWLLLLATIGCFALFLNFPLKTTIRCWKTTTTNLYFIFCFIFGKFERPNSYFRLIYMNFLLFTFFNVNFFLAKFSSDQVVIENGDMINNLDDVVQQNRTVLIDGDTSFLSQLRLAEKGTSYRHVYDKWKQCGSDCDKTFYAHTYTNVMELLRFKRVVVFGFRMFSELFCRSWCNAEQEENDANEKVYDNHLYFGSESYFATLLCPIQSPHVNHFLKKSIQHGLQAIVEMGANERIFLSLNNLLGGIQRDFDTCPRYHNSPVDLIDPPGLMINMMYLISILIKFNFVILGLFVLNQTFIISN